MSTQKKCHVCKEKIGVASKTCQLCRAKQPYKQKLEKRKQQYAEEWKSKQRKNGSLNKVYDATYLLLHKWEILERYPVALLAKRTTHGFSAECLCPRQMDREDVKNAFDQIKRIYENLLNATGADKPAAPNRVDISIIKTESLSLNQDILPSNTTVALANEPAAFNSEDTRAIKIESPPLNQDILLSNSTALTLSAAFTPAPAKLWSSPRVRNRTRNADASECSSHQEATSSPSKTITRRIIGEESQSEELLTLEPDHPESQASASSTSQSLSSLPVNPVSTRCVSMGNRSAESELSELQQSILTNLNKPKDYDELYFMSLVGTFKRLSLRKKAEVRMKIERILYEAEFE